MRKIIGAMVIGVILSGCTDPDLATRVLRQNNYTDIQITGFKPFGCAKTDEFSTGFSARAPNGERVWGVVCSGFLKGATIRVF